MTAHSAVFPWPSYYGHFEFFEDRMAAHNRISATEAQGGGLYKLKTNSGEALRVFVCECYSFGVAEYAETIENLGKLDVIVINSAWCGYTNEAKRHCRETKVGLFKIVDFMAALNKPDYWRHLNDHEVEIFKKKGWS